MFRIERRRRPIYPTIKKTPQISFRGSISAGLSRFRYQKIDRLLGGQYAPVYPLAEFSLILFMSKYPSSNRLAQSALHPDWTINILLSDLLKNLP